MIHPEDATGLRVGKQAPFRDLRSLNRDPLHELLRFPLHCKVTFLERECWLRGSRAECCTSTSRLPAKSPMMITFSRLLDCLSHLLGLFGGVLFVACCCRWAGAQEPALNKWAAALKAFEDQDRITFPAPGGVVFVGSSSIRLWNLQESFPGKNCINRGVGGATLAEVVKLIDRIVLPYQPRVVVLYAGDNDLAAKRTPEQIRDDYRSFVNHVQGALPEAQIVWIAIKPSPKRWALREQALQANRLVRAEIARGHHQVEIDLWNAMLDETGQPRSMLYAKDQLHLSPSGYALWTERLRSYVESLGE